MASLRFKNDLTHLETYTSKLLIACAVLCAMKFVYFAVLVMKKKLIIFLLAMHLLFIYMGTQLFSFGLLPPRVQLGVMYYLSLVGGHPYSFFSPDIPSQTIVTCLVTDSAGEAHTITFDQSRNTLELRSTYTMQLLADNHDYETITQLAHNYCAARYGHARKIQVSIGRYVAPMMEEYKAGKRGGIKEQYEQTFPNE